MRPLTGAGRGVTISPSRKHRATRHPSRRAGMSGDEAVILLVNAAIAIVYWGRWYVRLLLLDTLTGAGAIRRLIPLVHLLCFPLVLVALTTLAATEVREHI